MHLDAKGHDPGSVWITKTPAAKFLGCSVQTLNEMIDAGRLSVREIPGAWPRVNLAEVQALAEASTRRAAVCA